MEHSAETSQGTENAKNSRLLDLQKLYNTKSWVSSGRKERSHSSGSSSALKRKLGSEDQKRVAKKSKKEVLLSSLSSGKQSKKRAAEACQGRLSSASTQLGKSEPVDDQKVNGVGGLGGITLNLNANVSIPKRPRDLVGRKKVEVDPGTKQEGTSSSKASSDEGSGKLSGNPRGSLLHNGNVDEKLDLNGGSEGISSSGFIAKVKQKKSPGDHTESKSRGSNSHQNLKREGSHLSVHNSDASTKKARRTPKKTKEAKRASAGATKEKKQALDETTRICDGSQDDEENLEANAARMLSSRFDTSCTGYSSGAKSSKLPSTDVLSALISSTGNVVASQPNSRAESDVVSSDAEFRVLRPRDQMKGKGLLRKRRHFYEVLSREMDSYWVLNRRIKVFWPLDQSWYVGHVIAYDPDRKLHHIKYDDRDEEWVDLQNERFKLLLLPSEVPGKVGSKNSRIQDNQARKAKRCKTTDKEKNGNSYMESEPIISWLARSARQKSPTYGARNKHRTLCGTAKSQSSSFSEVKVDPQGSLEVGSSRRNADDLVCSSAFVESPADSLSNGKPLTENVISHNRRPPIVYFRRRFHRRKQQVGDIHGIELCQLSDKPPRCGNGPDFVDSFDLAADMLHSVAEYDHVTTRLSPDEFIWNTDDCGVLKLTIPVTNLKVFRLKLCLPLPVIINSLFGGQYFVHLLQNGSLVSLWPMVHLEFLFVDNIVGLRFLLYEGCLNTAVVLVFLVMDVFHLSNQNELLVDHQLPVTSIRFRFTGLQDLQRQLVFTFYNFSEVGNSKWSYLDRKLKQHCLLTKQLPPSECTYDNIKALRNGCNRLPLTCVSHKSSSVMNLQKRSRQKRMSITSRQSTCVRLNTLSCGSDEKLGKLPSFALSFAAAPTFFLSLHLKLLMEHSILPSTFGELDPVSLMDFSDPALLEVRNSGVLSRGNSELESCSNLDVDVSVSSDCAAGVATKACHSSQAFPENDANIQLEKGMTQLTEPDRHCMSEQPLDGNGQLSPVEFRLECSPSTGLTVEIPSVDLIERNANGGVENTQCSPKLGLDIRDCTVHSPGPTASRNIWHLSRVGRSSSSANLSPTWPDGKQDILRNGFGNGPKKPRTQVSYSLPFGGHDYNSKYKFHHAKGFPHKRIRRTSEKKTSEAFTTSQRNVELLSCDANVLVTVGDRGWRECGAKVVLELVDHNEWRLAVKISGDTKYSYKAHQFLQLGTTNRYTHAMMWKGGKDWILEFPDRSQWAMFKEMHEECYNRNFRAASVKNIPIPGVRLVEETDDNVPEVPFVRPSPKYHRQLETDVDIATDPGRVLYDMDSDDEQWVAKHRASDSNVSNCRDISDEMFERTMDVVEKVAYAKQRDHLSSDELEELAEFGPIEAIRIIHEHWREKRLRKGMPLIRHLQPPLWEKYQQQVKKWEQAMMKGSAAISSGCQEKPITIEKPPMFAFCLKPRGLEVPNRGSKQRSQKKLPVGAIGSVISGDQDAFHLVGRRLNGNALGDDRVIYAAYNQGTSDSSPVLQGSARVFSPRDAGGVGYFSLSSDGSEKSQYPKLYRNKSKKLCFIPSSNDQQPFASYSQRTMGKRVAIHGWNGSSSERHTPMDHQPDRFRRPSFEQLDPSEIDEFRLRDAASAARHAVTIAKMKRENAQRMLCRADLAMHKAVAAIMTAEAINASYDGPDDNI